MPSSTRAVALLIVLACAGCSTEREPGSLFGPSESGIPVVDAQLIVGFSFPEILISETTSPEEPWTREQAAVGDAAVQVVGPDFTLRYTVSDPELGVYFPVTQLASVAPDTEYRLEVDFPDGRRVRAVTHTPAAFRVNRWVLLEEDGETVIRELATYSDTSGEEIYEQNRLVHGQGLVEAQYARGDEPGVQVGVFSLDPDSDFAIDVSFLDPEDLEDFQRFESSPALVVPDGRLRLPWLAVFFTGRYQFHVFQVDQNWFNLLLSTPEFGGGTGFGGNTGDSFESPLFAVDGGIGLFGSAAIDSIGIYVVSPDSLDAP